MFYSSEQANIIQDNKLLFFAQSFLELSSYRSAESYKAKMMMPYSLCLEYELIFHHEFSKDEYLKVILEELKQAITSDKVAKKLLHFSFDEYEAKGLNDFNNKKAQHSVIKLIKEELEVKKYISETISLLEVESGKSEILSATSNLISLLNYIGYKNAYLFHSANKYFSNQSHTHSIRDFFVKTLFEIGDLYTVYIEIRKLPKVIDNDFFDNNLSEVKLLDTQEKQQLIESGIYKFNQQNQVIKFENVNARNPYSAIAQVNDLLNQVDIAYNIFSHSDKLKKGKTYLAIDVKTEIRYYFDTSISPLTHQKYMSHSSLKEKFHNFFTNFLIHSNSRYKFEKALTLHSYALRNDNHENQLIFFWTALETIVTKNHNKSIIDSVLTFILPFLKKRYFYENFKYIYEHVLHHKKDIIDNIFSTHHLELNLLNFCKILILDGTFEQIRNELINHIEDFPLLKQRIHSINKELKTPSKVCKKLERHTLNLIQQIHRIYRYRNLIIHDAKEVEIMNTLLSNLHNYFDYILDEIIENSYKKKILNIDELNLFLRMKLEKHEKDLKNFSQITEENFSNVFLLEEYI